MLPGQGILHEKVSVSFDKREALCILVQYEAELIIHLEQWHFIHLFDTFCYQIIMMLKRGTGQNFFITANSL